MPTPKKIFIIAGEASGDLHGRLLIDSLRQNAKCPLEIYGVGGDKIKNSGALEFYDLAHFHATGFTDAIRKIPRYKIAEKVILENIRKAQPDLVVLIDNPGFNLHLAAKIHDWQIPIVYYIAPQIWAWAPRRVVKIKKFVKKVLVVFEFEKKIYEENGVPVAWVGHPLRDVITKTPPSKKPIFESPRICLLPGSRKGEITRLLPIFAKAARRIEAAVPKARFFVIKSPTLPVSLYDRLFKETGFRGELVKQDAYEEIRRSSLAIVCSGTATLECALLGTPMIISNKGSFLTYLAAKSLARVAYLGIPNLILGGEYFPELLQYDATPQKIAKAALQILEDKTIRDKMMRAISDISDQMGLPGANQRAAKEILELL